VSCRPLDSPVNGHASCNGSMFEDVCTFTCDDGYDLSGTPIRTCQSDQTWSGSEATCSKGTMLFEVIYDGICFLYVAQCPVLTAPENGSISCSGTEFEDICNITCDDGFVVNGSNTITCGEDGTWSGEPECVLGGKVHVV